MAKDAWKCKTPHVLYDSETGEVKIIPCNSWQCESCCKLKAWWLNVRLAGSIELYFMLKEQSDFNELNVTMLTLTIASMDTDIMASWNTFLTNLRREGYLKKFFWVKEFQNRGARHLHIISFGRIPKKLIDGYWSQHGFSWISKIPYEKAGYVCKYLSKLQDQKLFYSHERRYSASRGFLLPIPKKHSDGKWLFFTYSQWNTKLKLEYDDHRIENGYVPDHGKLCPEYVFRVKPIGDPWKEEVRI